MNEEMREEIRVILLDDHDSFRQPLAFMLGREPDLTVVAQAGSLAEAREFLRDADLAVNVAVVDLELPDGSGVEFVRELYEAKPQALALVLSAYSDNVLLAEAIEAGAAGIMHKSSPLEKIIKAVRSLYTGEQLLSPQEVLEAVRLLRHQRWEDRQVELMISELTSREQEVLQALAEGLGDKEIAERLYVSVGTVRTHMTSILTKFKVNSRLQALVFAVRQGVVKIA